MTPREAAIEIVAGWAGTSGVEDTAELGVSEADIEDARKLCPEASDDELGIQIYMEAMRLWENRRAGR